jgi:hypothetical protein
LLPFLASSEAHTVLNRLNSSSSSISSFNLVLHLVFLAAQDVAYLRDG